MAFCHSSTTQVKTLPKSDEDKDGLINEQEWRRHVNKYSGEFMEGNMYAGGALRVVLYSPTYSCNPPTLFLILSESLKRAGNITNLSAYL